MVKEELKAFGSELEKLSSTAAARAFKKGVLSEGGLRIVSKYLNKDIGLKYLGKGASQRASLVMNPKHGKVVRKSLHEYASEGIIKNRDKEYAAKKYLKSISGKNTQIAQIVGRDGPVHYQEFVKGKSGADIAIKKARRVRKLGLSHTEMIRAGDNVYRKYNFDRPNFNKETFNVLKKFNKKYRNLTDVKRMNMVGNKLVDFDVYGDWSRKDFSDFVKTHKRSQKVAIEKGEAVVNRLKEYLRRK